MTRDPEIEIDDDTEVARLTAITALQNIESGAHIELRITDTEDPDDAETESEADQETEIAADGGTAAETGGETDGPFICEDCGDEFDGKQGLKVHVNQWCDSESDDSEGNEQVKCEDCGDSFNAHGLAIHHAKSDCGDDRTEDPTPADQTALDGDTAAVADGGATALQQFDPEYNWKPAPTNFERAVYHVADVDAPFSPTEAADEMPLARKKAVQAVNTMRRAGWLDEVDDRRVEPNDTFREKYRHLVTEGDRIKWPDV